MALSVTSPALSMHATPDVHVAEVHGKAAARCSLACPLWLVLVCAVRWAVASSSSRGTIEPVALLTFVQVQEFMSYSHLTLNGLIHDFLKRRRLTLVFNLNIKARIL